jgi:hypothetical protein
MDNNENTLETDPDFLNKVLSITRSQLHRMMSVNTELEALLLREQEKNKELAERLKRAEK